MNFLQNLYFATYEEKLCFAKLIDQSNICAKRHRNTFSDFLDPIKVEKYCNILKNERDIEYKVFGGYEDSERKMIGFYNSYCEIQPSDFPIRILNIKVKDKFCKPLNHRNYLGSLIGIGIERDKIGDIIVLENGAISFVHENIADYLLINLLKVSNVKVENSLIDIDNLILPPKKYKPLKSTVASLRIDAILSTTFNISRAKASEFINSERVNVNSSIVKNISFNIKQGDIFTLRGYGKAKLVEINGRTRKDRISILIYIYI